MEKSITNSEHSNLFNISSESSRRSKTNTYSKQQYSLFARKVKQLMETSGDDLDELYRKIQVIVKKYFNDNKIVQFKDMYEHILALKSNNKKMDHIINILQKKIVVENVMVAHQIENKQSNEVVRENKAGRHSFKNEDFETTSSSQKQSNKKEHRREEEQVLTNKQGIKADINLNNTLVITSLKQNFTASNQQQIETEQRDSIQPERWPEQNHSANRMVVTLDQYKSRNKTYQQKVKELMKQLQNIKKIATTNTYSHQIKSSESHPYNIQKQVLNHIDSQSSKPRESSSTTIIYDLHDAQNTTYNPRRSSIDIIEEHKHMIDEQILQNDGKPYNETLYIIQDEGAQSNLHHNISIQNHFSQHTRHQQSQATISKAQNSASNNSSNQQPPAPISKQQNEPSQQRKQLKELLQYTSNISQQIQQLQQVAQKLQLQSLHVITEQQQKTIQSSTELITQKQVTEMLNTAHLPQQGKKEILEQIDNAHSKSYITENMIPSFRQLNHHDITNQQSIKHKVFYTLQNNPIHVSSQNIHNSSQNIHSSNNYIPQPSVNSSLFKVPITRQQSQNTSSYNNNQMNHNIANGYQVSTVRYGYNPYDSLSIEPKKSYVQYSQPVNHLNMPLSVHNSSLNSYNMPSNVRRVQSQSYPMSSNNPGKNIVTQIPTVYQPLLVSNSHISNQSLHYNPSSPYKADTRKVQNQSIPPYLSINNTIKTQQLNKSREHLHRSSYASDNGQVRAMMDQNGRRVSGNMLNSSYDREDSVRMSDSLLKRRGIQVTSPK